MRLLIIHLLFLVSMCLCSSCNDTECKHIASNGVYYWKTILELDSSDYHFMNRHEVERIYLRMFDVAIEEPATSFEAVVPNASLQMSHSNDSNREVINYLHSKQVIPVIYITIEALKAAQGHEEQLARQIVERVRRMCSYHELPNVVGLQIDCDWTVSTELSYFALCDSARSLIAQKKLPWALSSTIRLHQLSREAPPVDYGVLMVYNTGDFSDPDAQNSIISLDDVKPYLKHLDNYPLHLDVAYPTYSWQLLFSDRQFVGLLNGVNVADTTCFATSGKNSYRALCNMCYQNKFIRKDDIIRAENSDFSEIMTVKNAIERRLHKRAHNNILYHLDQQNLSKYTADEIDKIYSTDQSH